MLAEAGVTTLGVAESCSHCAHISRSRYLNTVIPMCVVYIVARLLPRISRSSSCWFSIISYCKMV